MRKRRAPPSAKASATPATTAAPLLTEAQAAEWLGTSIWYLRGDRCGPRRIPFLKISRRCVRYRLSDIQKALDGMLVKSSPQAA